MCFFLRLNQIVSAPEIGETPRFAAVHGGVAEWPIAAVLKTAIPQGIEGSNPSASAIL